MSGNVDAVSLCRCSLTQQLSGPVTDTKRWVSNQFVDGDEAAGVFGVLEDEGCVGVDPPPHAVSVAATASASIGNGVMLRVRVSMRTH